MKKANKVKSNEEQVKETLDLVWKASRDWTVQVLEAANNSTEFIKAMDKVTKNWLEARAFRDRMQLEIIKQLKIKKEKASK